MCCEQANSMKIHLTSENHKPLKKLLFTDLVEQSQIFSSWISWSSTLWLRSVPPTDTILWLLGSCRSDSSDTGICFLCSYSWHRQLESGRHLSKCRKEKSRATNLGTWKTWTGERGKKTGPEAANRDWGSGWPGVEEQERLRSWGCFWGLNGKAEVGKMTLNENWKRRWRSKGGNPSSGRVPREVKLGKKIRGRSPRLDELGEWGWNENWTPVKSKPGDLSAKKRQKVHEFWGGTGQFEPQRLWVKEWNQDLLSRDCDWTESLRNEEQDFWSVTGEYKKGWDRNKFISRAEVAMFWCDSQRKVSVYQQMTFSKATQTPGYQILLVHLPAKNGAMVSGLQGYWESTAAADFSESRTLKIQSTVLNALSKEMLTTFNRHRKSVTVF